MPISQINTICEISVREWSIRRFLAARMDFFSVVFPVCVVFFLKTGRNSDLDRKNLKSLIFVVAGVAFDPLYVFADGKDYGGDTHWRLCKSAFFSGISGRI